MENKCLSIEINNKNYIIIDKIMINNIEYWYLTNSKDVTDFMVQKLNSTGNAIVNLDSEREFDLAMLEFSKKHMNDEL